MGESTALLHGIVRNGVIVPNAGTSVPEGAVVQFSIVADSEVIPLPKEWEQETAMWEKLSDEAWSQIDWGEGEIARDSG